MLWVRIPPEQLFSFSVKKELFKLVVLLVFIYVGVRVSMYNNYRWYRYRVLRSLSSIIMDGIKWAIGHPYKTPKKRRKHVIRRWSYCSKWK